MLKSSSLTINDIFININIINIITNINNNMTHKFYFFKAGNPF